MNDDEARFRALGAELRTAVLTSLPGWIERVASDRLGENLDTAALAELVSPIVEEAAVGLDRLVTAPLDAPVSGPLEQTRRAVGPLSDLISRSGGSVELLGPMTFSDLGPDVHELGIAWGAAKAHLHLSRRRTDPPPHPPMELN